MAESALMHIIKVVTASCSDSSLNEYCSSKSSAVVEGSTFVRETVWQLINQGYYSSALRLQQILFKAVMSNHASISLGDGDAAVIGVLEDTMRALIRLSNLSRFNSEVSSSSIIKRLRVAVRSFDYWIRENRQAESSVCETEEVQTGSRIIRLRPEDATQYHIRRAHLAYIMGQSVLQQTVTSESLDKLLQWFVTEDRGFLKFLSGATACFLACLARQPQFVALHAEEVVQSGKGLTQLPKELQLISGIPLQCTVPLLWLSSLLKCGETDLRGPQAAFQASLQILPVAERPGPVALMRRLCSNCEPQASRLMHRYETAGLHISHTGQISFEWVMVIQAQQKISAAQWHSKKLARRLLSGPLAEDSEEANGLRGLENHISSWRLLTLEAIDFIEQGWATEDLLGVTRNCVHEASRVMLPYQELGDAMDLNELRVTVVGMQHMSNAVECLERCIKVCHERGLIDSAGGSASPLVRFCQAMLSWFQWRLKTAHTGDMVSGSRILVGVCKSLLEAQALALQDTDAPEILTGGLQATVGLAHMLCGDGIPGRGPHFPSLDMGSVSSAEFQAFMPTQLNSDSHSIPVSNISFGSPDGTAVAVRHLEEILMHVTAGGSPINTGLPQQDLVTVQEAMQVLKRLRADLAGLNSGLSGP
uniref:Uncharacterized protein n=1 Tax=Tetraselmis sp. GSL018 TaxID=582737 RepID=A0A061RWT6_9CHLO